MADDVFPNHLDKVFVVQTDTSCTFQIRRLPYRVLELEDLRFHLDSAVLLPDPPADPSQPAANQGADPQKPRVTSLVVLAACLREVEAKATERLLIAAHADTSGDAQYNVTLTEKRADNTHAILLGEREKFVSTAMDKHRVEDVQHILHWFARDWGWECDPKKIDNKPGPDTDAAVKGFRGRYNSEFGQSIPETSAVDADFWGAVFDGYNREIAEILEADEAKLAAKRQKVQFADAGKHAIGCGESFPIDAPQKNNYRSQTNRRVELLLFEDRDIPKLACHPARGKCSAADCQIHDPRLYEPTFVEVAPVPPHIIRRAFTQITVSLRNRVAELIKDAPFRMQAGGVTKSGRASDGIGKLTVPGLPERCLVEWGRAPDPDIGTGGGDKPPCFQVELYLTYDQGTNEEQAKKRLHNIGYPDTHPLDESLRAFQDEHGLPVTGRLDDKTKKTLIDAHGNLATAVDIPEPPEPEPQVAG